MAHRKLANFLITGAMESESEADGREISDVLCDYGWQYDLQDPYQFVTAADTFSQVEIIQRLFTDFARLTPRDKDTAFGMFIWCTDNEAFYFLVDTKPGVQSLLCQLMLDETTLEVLMSQFGCKDPQLVTRLRYCWNSVIADFAD